MSDRSRTLGHSAYHSSEPVTEHTQAAEHQVGGSQMQQALGRGSRFQEKFKYAMQHILQIFKTLLEPSSIYEKSTYSTLGILSKL